MDLTREETPATTTLRADGTFSASAGQTFKIETAPHGEEIMTVTVPEGKKWQSIAIRVRIVEADA